MSGNNSNIGRDNVVRIPMMGYLIESTADGKSIYAYMQTTYNGGENGTQLDVVHSQFNPTEHYSKWARDTARELNAGMMRRDQVRYDSASGLDNVVEMRPQCQKIYRLEKAAVGIR
ncbi:MAG: hypothetical protein ABIG89_03030 [Candidatus Woesearchaeota archaeon]